MDTLAYFSIKKPDVVHETIDGETVIVNLENGVYYSLRSSAVDVWNSLEDGANLEELTAMMLERYDEAPDHIKEAVRSLLVTLQAEGLVQISSAKRPGNAAPRAGGKDGKKKFEPPLLEKYSDMQELLLLDPIHEVDEEGWPHKADADGGPNAGGA